MEARQSVVVDDAVDRLVLGLERDIVPDRSQVVAEMDDPRRLDAREDPRTGGTERGGIARVARGGGDGLVGHGPRVAPSALTTRRRRRSLRPNPLPRCGAAP